MYYVYSVCAVCLQYITVCTVCMRVEFAYAFGGQSQPQLLFLTVLTPLFPETMLTESGVHQIG